ncbi:MAG: 3-keto-5-aminohexanoate cleavage protein [Syntrophus sp. RIFOXYC2_FULL_54_9]|nr:MAG: 3-keto-5-aminohexanoate cleavage protein [Syntrophus sp. GWC2_56_31]OHE30621.1 MAG: 3-keto-5-aminohexanoate cleavage protein [Syntrophus sp. RIFOXYC2_FULL_54_9]HBB15600.1 3-keto-5-aminohexanoate cleavage protein [Syntrophus sp. (in: bacteria)]
MSNDKIILSVATTGSWALKSHNPALPITPGEIARAAVESWREGASVVHVHVRDDAGAMSCDLARFRRVKELIRAQGCDAIINFSTSGGAGRVNEDERFNSLAAGPELASLDAGSINFNERVFLNSPDFLEELARRMLEAHVKPEIEAFDSGMIGNAMTLIEKGLIKTPLWWQFVLGVKGGAAATVRSLVHLVESLPAGSLWSVCAVGWRQLPLNVQAIVMGGHARTGLEDNLYYRRGELAQSNAQLVARLARIARECGREPATPNEAREILGLTGTGGSLSP